MAREETRTEADRITVRVLFFGAARDVVGQSEVALSLRVPAEAASAFEQVLAAYPALRRFGRSLLFAINEEYAPTNREVREGDELAVFPPVSGGSGTDAETARRGDAETRRPGDAETRRRGDPETRRPGDAETASREDAETRRHGDTEIKPETSDSGAQESRHDFFELTSEPIDVGAVARRVVLPECGATVTLDGYARAWTSGRRTLYLVYEAYQTMALRELRRLGREARARFNVAHIGIVHRTGRLEIGETSVVIAVSAPHRRAAFEACEWAIRELKRTVPIWKKEIFEDGEVWVEGEGLKAEGHQNESAG